MESLWNASLIRATRSQLFPLRLLQLDHLQRILQIWLHWSLSCLHIRGQLTMLH